MNADQDIPPPELTDYYGSAHRHDSNLLLWSTVLGGSLTLPICPSVSYMNEELIKIPVSYLYLRTLGEEGRKKHALFFKHKFSAEYLKTDCFLYGAIS
jgi:hypothetical protein